LTGAAMLFATAIAIPLVSCWREGGLARPVLGIEHAADDRVGDVQLLLPLPFLVSEQRALRLSLVAMRCCRLFATRMQGSPALTRR
jgi:hypothetical protein